MKKPSLLLVDNDPAHLETLAAIAEDDFLVTIASSGFEALELLKKKDFLVVCADYQMPEMSGLELLRHVTEMPAYIAGVLLTGHTDVLIDAQWLEQRTVRVVFKPCDPLQLIDHLKQLAALAWNRRILGRPHP